MISQWKYALPAPRLIELEYKTPPKELGSQTSAETVQEAAASYTWVSKTTIPAMLHVCVESRIEALKVYKLGLGYGGNDGKIFIDFSHDTLLIGDQTRDLFSNVWTRGFP